MKHTTMRRNRLRAVVPTTLLTLLLAPGLAACGEESGDTGQASATSKAGAATDEAEAAGALAVEDPWVRATSGTEDTSMTAAFMTLDNTGETELTVTGASASVAGRAELHEMAMVDGVSAMRQIEGGIVLAPGRGQLLQPGGNHVMLMELTGELAPGDEVELTLELSDGSQVTITAPVKEFTEEEGHYHEPGTEEHGHADDADDDMADDMADDMGDDMGEGQDDGNGHP